MTTRKLDDATLVQSLAEWTRRFSRSSAAKKRQLLAALKDRPIRDGALLRQLHEALCFMRACPDDAALLGIVEQSLAAFPRRLDGLQASGAQAEAAALDGIGAIGTTVRCAFSLPLVRWLLDRFPDAVDIDWDQPETEVSLGCIFSMLSGPVAEEPLVEADTTYRSWVKLHKGDRSISDLQWLLGLLEEKIPDGRVRRAFYDRLSLFIRWELREGDLPDKATHGPRQAVFHPSGTVEKPGAVLPHSLPGEPVAVRPVASIEAKALIDLARTAMAVRHRETHAFNYADPRDVRVADLGRGIQIAWFGVVPEHRLPLRALFGFLILKNSIPVGYGDAALLFDWIDGGGGISIFETFRHGESAFIFHRLVAFLHQQLGIRAIHISRWDIGHHNPEGIESRAFWFYYRLGFRPKDDGLRQLADREHQRIKTELGYRSSRKTLEKLSRAGMFLGLDNDGEPSVHDFETRRVTLKAGALCAQTGSEKLMADLADMIGAKHWQAWDGPDRLALERLAPVLALIPDLHRWPSGERRAILNLIRAKAGRSEADYLRQLSSLPRLRAVILGLGAPDTG